MTETGGASRGVARLLRPRSVAIVGVSPEAGSLGGAVLGNLERFGYGGAIHLVSRGRAAVAGRPCLAAVDDLPHGVDAAVLCLPQAAVAEAVAACARRGVGSAVVFAAGFAEMGGAGKAAQDEMLRAACAGGVALCGPNCVGLVNYRDRVPLTYEPIPPAPPEAGPCVAILAQSGAMASVLRIGLLAKGLGVSCVVSTGNEAGLGVEDFLEFLLADEGTRVIALFTEQIRHPARFLALAAAARARGRPIVLMHPGRVARARASALSHTGALTGDHSVMSALVAHEGVVLVETMEELIDASELLARFAHPPRAGAAIVTNSGAFKGYAIDLCDRIGLEVPRLAPETLTALGAALPPFAPLDNPLDVTGQSIKDPGILGASSSALLADSAIGSLVVSIVPGAPHQAMDKANALLPSLVASAKPVAVAVMGDESPLPAEFAAAMRSKNLPFFRSPDRALRAMAHATRYGRALAAEPRASGPVLPPVILPRTGTLCEYEAKSVLAAIGIAVPEGGLARDLAAARAIATRVGYPLALKAQSPALAHKSEAGGVILGVAGEDALAAAWERLHANLRASRSGLALDGVLVERMGRPGIELAIGARRDPQWGAVVMVGLGGVWMEALEDFRLMPADLGEAAIRAEIANLKGASLLDGFRGAPPADVAALAHAIARIGALVRARPEIVELDINPLAVHEAGAGVTALDALIHSAAP